MTPQVAGPILAETAPVSAIATGMVREEKATTANLEDEVALRKASMHSLREQFSASEQMRENGRTQRGPNVDLNKLANSTVASKAKAASSTPKAKEGRASSSALAAATTTPQQAVAITNGDDMTDADVVTPLSSTSAKFTKK